MPSDLASLIPMAVAKSGWIISEVVCGLARGADTLGKEWAVRHNVQVKDFPADWNKHGKAAGPIRNAQMGQYADAAIVFIWNDSRGSKNMIETMKRLKKPCYVVPNGDLDGAYLTEISEEIKWS